MGRRAGDREAGDRNQLASSWIRPVLGVQVSATRSAATLGGDHRVDRARLIRDRDGIYGAAFDARVRNLGIEQVRTAPGSPWQNGYAERFVGTLRRELLDHVVVLGERHFLHLVRQHASYYNEDRPHMCLDGDAPLARAVEGREAGKVAALPRVSGLHHRYIKKAA
jgi:putative transposase